MPTQWSSSRLSTCHTREAVVGAGKNAGGGHPSQSCRTTQQLLVCRYIAVSQQPKYHGDWWHTFNMPKNAPIWHLIQTLLLLITQIIRNLLLRRPLKALILQLHRQQTEMLMLMEGGTLPDLEGAVRRVTINDEDRPAGSAIRCREDHDKRHQGWEFWQRPSRLSAPSRLLVSCALSYVLDWMIAQVTPCVFCVHITVNAANKMKNYYRIELNCNNQTFS